MSKKKKYTLTAAVVIANLLIIFIMKDWENLRKGRIIAPYRYPSKSQVVRWAADIERHLNEGDIDFVVDRYDGNAQEFFDYGVTNWVSEEENNFEKDVLRASLAGVQGCQLKECDADAGSVCQKIDILYELVYEDGSKVSSGAELFKDRRGGLGVASFIVNLPKESLRRIYDQQRENKREK